MELKLKFWALKYDETKESIPEIGILNLNKNKAPISHSESILKVVLAPERYRLHPFEEKHILNKLFESILTRAKFETNEYETFCSRSCDTCSGPGTRIWWLLIKQLFQRWWRHRNDKNFLKLSWWCY